MVINSSCCRLIRWNEVDCLITFCGGHIWRSPGWIDCIMYLAVLFVVANLHAINRKEKDPLKPKHPTTAFFAFSQARRPDLLEEKKYVTEVLSRKINTGLFFLLSILMFNSFSSRNLLIATLPKDPHPPPPQFSISKRRLLESLWWIMSMLTDFKDLGRRMENFESSQASTFWGGKIVYLSYSSRCFKMVWQSC